MSGANDIDGLAAEYVLGTLDADERAAANEQRNTNRELEAAIQDWQRRLAPLNDVAAGLDPPDHLEAAILSRIERERAGTRLSAPWFGGGKVLKVRGSIAAAAALAACLIVAVILAVKSDSRPQIYAAALQMSPDSRGTADAAMSPQVVLDTGIGELKFTSGPLKAIAGKTYVLWASVGIAQTPVRLGFVPVAGNVSLPWPKQIGLKGLDGARLFMTLEPQETAGANGIPMPSGSTIFEGRLSSRK